MTVKSLKTEIEHKWVSVSRKHFIEEEIRDLNSKFKHATFQFGD